MRRFLLYAIHYGTNKEEEVYNRVTSACRILEEEESVLVAAQENLEKYKTFFFKPNPDLHETSCRRIYYTYIEDNPADISLVLDSGPMTRVIKENQIRYLNRDDSSNPSLQA